MADGKTRTDNVAAEIAADLRNMRLLCFLSALFRF